MKRDHKGATNHFLREKPWDEVEGRHDHLREGTGDSFKAKAFLVGKGHVMKLSLSPA